MFLILCGIFYSRVCVMMVVEVVVGVMVMVML